jgi:acetyltransferase-like isoleucine patch superfamily enzyme
MFEIKKSPFRILLSLLPAAFSFRFLRKAKGLKPETKNRNSLTLGDFVSLKYAALTNEGKNVIGEGTKISGEVFMGYGSTIGRYSNLFGGPIRIGRYCQFGPCVAIYAMNHPYTYLTSYVNRNLFEGRLKVEQEHGYVQIGNDVWIGHGAIILPGVTVGDGAVIGAGTVVTSNVEDFSIVVGNPGREIGKRFSAEIIELIRTIQWWNLTPAQLLEIEALFHIDLKVNANEGLERMRDYLSRRGH